MKSKKITFKVLIILIVLLALIVIDKMHLPYLKKQKTEEICFVAKNGKPIMYNGRDLLLEFSPTSVYRLKPDYQSKKYKINSLGFRGEEINPGNEQDKKKIILTGGSAVFGWKIYDEGKTIPALIQKHERDWLVLNAGVPGYTSYQELLFMYENIIEMKPYIIITYSFWNDLFMGLTEDSDLVVNNAYRGYEYYLAEYYTANSSVKSAVRILIKAILSKSNIGRMIQVKNNQKANMKEKERIKNELKSNVVEERFEKVIKQYCKNIKYQKSLAESNNIKFLVVIQPELGSKNLSIEEKNLSDSLFQGYADLFSPYYRKGYIIIEKFLIENKIPYININKQKRFVDNQNCLFIDVVHTNYEGNKIIAEIISDYIKNRFPEVKLTDEKESSI